MTQEGLYLAKDGLGHLDGTWPALGLTQLTQGGKVVHGMGKRLIVPVHQAQALQEDMYGSVYALIIPELRRWRYEAKFSRLIKATQYNSNSKFKKHLKKKKKN